MSAKLVKYSYRLNLWNGMILKVYSFKARRDV